MRWQTGSGGKGQGHWHAALAARLILSRQKNAFENNAIHSNHDMHAFSLNWFVNNPSTFFRAFSVAFRNVAASTWLAMGNSHRVCAIAPRSKDRLLYSSV